MIDDPEPLDARAPDTGETVPTHRELTFGLREAVLLSILLCGLASFYVWRQLAG